MFYKFIYFLVFCVFSLFFNASFSSLSFAFFKAFSSFSFCFCNSLSFFFSSAIFIFCSIVNLIFCVLSSFGSNSLVSNSPNNFSANFFDFSSALSFSTSFNVSSISLNSSSYSFWVFGTVSFKESKLSVFIFRTFLNIKYLFKNDIFFYDVNKIKS